MLSGNTLFVGDSITVGLSPFVEVDGRKDTVAKSGASTAQILNLLKLTESALDAKRNMVVLGGTNDIGGGLSADAIFGNLKAIWAIGKTRGLRIIALTIPPAKGYVGFAGNFEAINAKRKQVNSLILQSGEATVDLDKLLGDSSDSDRLSSNVDGGDHLHPQKAKMGALLNNELAGLSFSFDKSALQSTSGIGTKVAVASGCAAAGWAGWELYKHFWGK